MKLEGEWNQNREHLLAGIGHLATHSAEVLEAVPDGVDVGHSHEYDLTVGVVLCTHKRRVERKSTSWKQASRTRAVQWAKLPRQGRTLQDGNSIYPGNLNTLLPLDAQVPYTNSDNNNINDNDARVLLVMTIYSKSSTNSSCSVPVTLYM